MKERHPSDKPKKDVAPTDPKEVELVRSIR
jgi:hypothetical protein